MRLARDAFDMAVLTLLDDRSYVKQGDVRCPANLLKKQSQSMRHERRNEITNHCSRSFKSFGEIPDALYHDGR